jgi:hypothetical protein
VLWSLLLSRLNALVAVADSMRSRKQWLYTAHNLTGFALVAYMLSSFGQRPSDWAHLAPLKNKLKEFSCPRSSLLFVPGLFKLSDDKRYWQCTASLRQHISNLYDSKVASLVRDDVVTISSFFPPVPPVGDTNESFAHFKFTTAVYAPLIDSNGCEFFWHTVSLFKAYGPSSDCVVPFTQIMFKELLTKATRLGNYTKDANSTQQVYQLGHAFFSNLSNLSTYLKVIPYSWPSYFDVTLKANV